MSPFFLIVPPNRTTVVLTSGQIVLNYFPSHGSGSISLDAAYCSEQPGAVCQGCIALPLYGGLPLTGGPGCSIFWRRDGCISSRAAPFPRLGKGGGLPVFSATGSTSKSRADMLAFGPKRCPVCKGFRPQP